MTLVFTTLTGCGGSKPDTPFGQVTGHDQLVMQQIGENFTDYNRAYVQVMAGLRDNDIPAASDALPRLADAVDAADSNALELDNHTLRQRMERYTTAARGLSDALTRVIAYSEADTAPDQATEDRLIAAVQTATNTMRREDRALVETMADAAAPKDRARIRQEYRAALAAAENGP